MTLIQELNGKKILILGMGKEGVDSFYFFKKNINYKRLSLADIVSVNNLNEEAKKIVTEGGVRFYGGVDYLDSVSDYDVIVKSPGIPLSGIKIKDNQIITSQSDIFLSSCKDTVIGVTGTKGKSTLCTLLHEILKKANFSSVLVGNVGVPALSRLPLKRTGNIFIYELSSFQLQTVTKSPHIAVILNIYKDHLDHHVDFEDYISSKEKITAFQKKDDYLFFNKNDKIVSKIAKKSIAKKVSFKEADTLPYKIMDIFGIDKKTVDDVLQSFEGLEHRREYVGMYKGVEFYNDSASTIPEATVKAIDSLPRVGTLIIGGSDKGADLNILVNKINKSSIENIVILKRTPKEVGSSIDKSKQVFFAKDMQEAVNYAFKNTKKGKKCLLSPGFASFNMFKSYKQRGECYKKIIRKHCYEK